MPEHEEGEYILGTDPAELDRLRLQHEVWTEQAHAIWKRAGFGAGQVLLDLGCGPGFTTIELARIVGEGGKVIGWDRSKAFLRFLEAERGRRSLDRIETGLGEVEDLELPEASLDGVYARWLFCWLDDPGAVLARVARAVKPGGVVAIQDYLDWGAMKLVPRSDSFDRVVEACLRSWIEGGISIDVGDRTPLLAKRCGLEVASFLPVARVGRPGSPEWSWLESFFRIYLPKLIGRGLFTTQAFEAFLADWERRSGDGVSFACTPTMFDAVLRKP